MRISDWSSDVCSSDLIGAVNVVGGKGGHALSLLGGADNMIVNAGTLATLDDLDGMVIYAEGGNNSITNSGLIVGSIDLSSGNNSSTNRSEEHSSELQSIMRLSSAAVCLTTTHQTYLEQSHDRARYTLDPL